jgi:hypothetical protein
MEIFRQPFKYLKQFPRVRKDKGASLPVNLHSARSTVLVVAPMSS